MITGSDFPTSFWFDAGPLRYRGRTSVLRRALIVGVALVLALTGVGLAKAAGPVGELRDGDRVVLLGGTVVERDQRFGYLETLLTLANPDKALTFRNLGWSGDTVLGEARAGFGTQPDGFKHLKEHVIALQPTVLLVGYGMNESFEGPAGLTGFLANLNALLDVLNETKARIILLPPLRHEDLGHPLPDPARHNGWIADYTTAISKVATDRGLPIIDLSPLYETKPGAPHLTDNGIHLNDYGAWRFGSTVAAALGCAPEPWQASIQLDAGTIELSGTRLAGLHSNGKSQKIDLEDRTLPKPQEPKGAGATAGDRRLSIKLSPGRYRLMINGEVAATATAAEWESGVTFRDSQRSAATEKLRQTINAKNLLYFHRWRPQNETYLFGFRKHEQGNNAREIPLFDPLVDAMEKEIAKLRIPVKQSYELVRESEVSQ